MENNIKTVRKHSRVLEGSVVSDKMDKTIVIRVESRQKHPLYGKTISKNKRFKAHDEKNECILGDIVRVVECRPMSKEKSFRLVSILKRAERVEQDKIDSDVEGVLKREKKSTSDSESHSQES